MDHDLGELHEVTATDEEITRALELRALQAARATAPGWLMLAGLALLRRRRHSR